VALCIGQRECVDDILLVAALIAIVVVRVIADRIGRNRLISVIGMIVSVVGLVVAVIGDGQTPTDYHRAGNSPRWRRVGVCGALEGRPEASRLPAGSRHRIGVH
jgi:hypothetical protein